MTPSEFKSWFAVFIEAVDGTPTPRQWAKIQKRVDEMGKPMPCPNLAMSNYNSGNALSGSQQYNMQNTTSGLISGACTNNFNKPGT